MTCFRILFHSSPFHSFHINPFSFISQTTATVTKLPTKGTLYQLSYVFDKHGYDPKTGTPITTVPTLVTGQNSRLVYRRPDFDYSSHIIDGDQLSKRRDSDEFEYTVNDNRGGGDSLPGKITFVSNKTRRLVSSEFLFTDEGWKTVGNKHNITDVRHEAAMRGDMNRYIYGVDDLIDVDANRNDRKLWKFLLPEKYTGWFGVWYGGTFEFTLSSLNGDYSGVNSHWVDEKLRPLNLVEIYCRSCDLFQGVTIAFPLSNTQGFDGNTTSYSLVMKETEGWMKDPQNVLFEWTVPSKCSFIEVLSGITSVRILGDFTNWYETVSIDNVRWVAASSRGRYHVPICAQDTPDCRKCSC